MVTSDLKYIQTEKQETQTGTRTYSRGKASIFSVFHPFEEGRMSLMTVGSRVASALIEVPALRSHLVTTFPSADRPRPSRRADDLENSRKLFLPLGSLGPRI